MPRRLFFLALLGLFWLSNVDKMMAQGGQTGDESTIKIVKLVLGGIQRGECGPGIPCKPATPEELASPPITVSEARSVITRGAISGIAELCGLDWKNKNFTPMMAYWRKVQKKNERQMALIGMLHGFVQSTLKSRETCTDQKKLELQAKLAFQP